MDTMKRWSALQERMAVVERELAVAESREKEARAQLAEAVAEVQRMGFASVEELETEVEQLEAQVIAAIEAAEEAIG